MGGYTYSTYWKDLHARHRGALTAVGYNRLGEGFNRASYKLRRRAVLRLLGRHPELRPGKLLEAAVGVGAYAEVWRRMGVGEWHGLDISAEAVAYCRTRFPEGRFHVQDLAAGRWTAAFGTDEEFDLVTAIDVLYHLVEDGDFAEALQQLQRRLRPGGGLLVSDVFGQEDHRVASHVKRRSLKSYQRVLGESLRLADRESVFAILGDPFPRPGRRMDWLLSKGWNGLALTLLNTPRSFRNAAGAAAVHAAWPLDAGLRALGLSRGLNLELALFLKRI